MINKMLLPGGFYDLLNPKAEKKSRIINLIVSYLLKNKYDLIDPPLLEFEEVFFQNNFSSLNADTYRLLDPMSNKMMVIRSDITPQIARIALTKFKNKILRYAYSGQVLRIKKDLIDGARQHNQTGIELIGDDSKKSDFEVIKIMIDSLKKIGLKEKEIILELLVPDLVKMIINHANLTNNNKKQKAVEFISKKDYAAAINLLEDKIPVSLLKLLDINFDPSITNITNFPDDIADSFKRIIDLKKALSKKFPDIKITFDLADIAKFPYQEKLGFFIFTTKSPIEIVKGGRYIIYDEAKKANIPAVGASFRISEAVNIY